MPEPGQEIISESQGLRRLFAVCCGALSGALVLVFCYAVFHRYLINDDYQTLYTAWQRAQGKVPGKDFFLASYYLLADLVAPLFHLSKEGWLPLYLTRFALLAVLIGICVLLYRASRILFDTDTGRIAPILLLSSAAMLHRGVDLRPDLLTGLLWIVVLVLLARQDPFTQRTALWMGLVLGLAIVNRFKGILVVPLMLGGVGVLAVETEGNRLRFLASRLLAIGGGFLLALVLYLLPTILSDGFATFAQINRTLFSDLYSLGSAPHGAYSGVLAESLLSSVEVDSPFWALTAWGLGLRMARYRGFSLRSNVLCAALAGTAVISVALNPAFYVYNFVTLQVILVLFAAYPIAVLTQRIAATSRSIWAAGAATVAVLVAPVALQRTQISEILRNTNAHQKQLAQFISAYLPPNAPVFALEGVGLYRPSVFHWRFPEILSGRYRRGDWNYVEELSAVPAELVILSYRLPGWLKPADIQFLQAHYVSLTPLLYVPGYDTRKRTGIQSFDLLLGGSYEVFLRGEGPVLLDGQVVHQGDRVTVGRGQHTLDTRDTRCMLRRWYPAAAWDLVANPQGLPYFTPPELFNPERVTTRMGSAKPWS